MQARCPHCRNVFATERTGNQFCPHCGKEIDVPDVAPGPIQPPVQTSPGGGGTGEASATTGRSGTAWEHRRELGFFRGLLTTWKDTLFKPTVFWAEVDPNGPVWDAIAYAWLVFLLQALLMLPLALVELQGLLGNLTTQLQGQDLNNPGVRILQQLSEAQGGVTATVCGAFVVGLVVFPLGLVIGSAILHVFALLFGAGKNGYWATLRVVAYAYAPAIFGIIPCVSIFASIYQVVLMVLGLASVQETTQGKAAAVMVSPFVLAGCCGCGLVGVFAATISASLQHLH